MDNQENVPSSEAANAEQKLENLGQDFEQMVTSALKQGSEVIRKHPVESMLAGFGLGCLVGALLVRNRN